MKIGSKRRRTKKEIEDEEDVAAEKAKKLKEKLESIDRLEAEITQLK